MDRMSHDLDMEIALAAVRDVYRRAIVEGLDALAALARVQALIGSARGGALPVQLIAAALAGGDDTSGGPPCWPLDDIASVTEIAAQLGTGVPAVSQWASRYADYPRPLVRAGVVPLYSLSAVRAWHAHKWPDKVVEAPPQP